MAQNYWSIVFDCHFITSFIASQIDCREHGMPREKNEPPCPSKIVGFFQLEILTQISFYINKSQSRSCTVAISYNVILKVLCCKLPCKWKQSVFPRHPAECVIFRQGGSGWCWNEDGTGWHSTPGLHEICFLHSDLTNEKKAPLCLKHHEITDKNN